MIRPNLETKEKAWRALLLNASQEVNSDLGTGTLTAEDLAYEIAVFSNCLAGHSTKGGLRLEPMYADYCLKYLPRLFAVAQRAFPPDTVEFVNLWGHLRLAYNNVESSHTTEAMIELDNAMVYVNALSGSDIGVYAKLETVRFLIRKFKERLSRDQLPPSEYSEFARTFELDGILSGVCNSCEEIGLNIKGLGDELVPLFEALYHLSIPELSKVEALELALQQN